MKHEDYYTGEPVETGSPQVFQGNVIDTGAVSNQEAEAASMASFGKYDYDPAARAAAIQTAPVPLSGGGYGGYYNPYQQPYGGGLGTPPPWYGGYGYTPYGNPQPTYGYYKPPYQQQTPQQMPTQYTIPPLSYASPYIPPANYEAEIDRLQTEFYMRQQQLEAQQSLDRQNSAYGYNNPYGYNYYGIPYYNPYQYNSLIREYSSKLDTMKQEAMDRRIEFNINISKVAHNFTRGKLSDEDIREMYTGKTVDIPQAIVPEQYYQQERFTRMEPFDNSQYYRNHYAALKREFDQIIPPDSDLKQTLANMAIIQAKWDLEEEQHRRRDGGMLYNSGDAYKAFVRQKAKERCMQEKGIVSGPPVYSGMPVFNGFNPSGMANTYVSGNPILNKAASVSEDGTLNVSISLPANVGSHKGEIYTVNNSQEAEYEEKRERFGRFLDSIPGNIYLDQQKQKKLEDYHG